MCFVDLQIVTALSIAGDLSFNPETDSLTGTNGEAYMQFPQLLIALDGSKFEQVFLQNEVDVLLNF